MDALKKQLEAAQTRRQTAKHRYMTFKKDLHQVRILHNKMLDASEKVYANTPKSEKQAKAAKRDSSLRIRACLTRTADVVLEQADQIQPVRDNYEHYHQRLEKELDEAECNVADAKAAIAEYRHSRRTQVLGRYSTRQELCKTRQEKAWEASRRVLDDYASVEERGWNDIFPCLWTRCGWDECKTTKNSLRKQFMCKHLVSRFFLHLDTQGLEEEKERWHPEHFQTLDSSCSRKFQELAAELVGDIEYALEQRKGGESYLWEQRRLEWFPEFAAVQDSRDEVAMIAHKLRNVGLKGDCKGRATNVVVKYRLKTGRKSKEG